MRLPRRRDRGHERRQPPFQRRRHRHDLAGELRQVSRGKTIVQIIFTDSALPEPPGMIQKELWR